MPEGDTLHKLARRLRPRLEGRALARVWLRDRGFVPALRGAEIREVVALGKHLLFGLRPVSAPDPGRADGARDAARAAEWVLHVHLGMHGRWRATASSASEPRWPAVVALDVPAERHVCARASIAELLPRTALAGHPRLSRLGPDLAAGAVSPARITERARRREPRSVADLLLDQTVACGIGNVYKSEVLFLEGVHPDTSVAHLDDARVAALYRRAAALLRWNLGEGRRVTVRGGEDAAPLRPGEPRHWVYGRAGRPCLRCGERVRAGRHGDTARATWWCPRCQPSRASQSGVGARVRYPPAPA